MSNLYTASKLRNGNWLTPICRIAWPVLEVPKPKLNPVLGPDGKPKVFYSATLLFDTTKVDISPVFADMQAYAAEVFAQNKAGKRPWEYDPQNFHWALKDGSNKISKKTGEVLAGYGSGVWYTDCSTQIRPALYDQQGQVITEVEKIGQLFYGGAVCRAQIRFYHYGSDARKGPGKSGVGTNLYGLQFVSPGEPFASPGLEPDAFDAVE